MKKLIVMLTCVAFMIGIAGMVSAQSKTSPAPKKDKVRGTVMAVDTAAKVITVKSKQARLSFTVNDATRLLLNSKQVKLEAIPVDAVVTILYMRHGNDRLALWVMAEARGAYSSVGKQQTRPGTQD